MRLKVLGTILLASLLLFGVVNAASIFQPNQGGTGIGSATTTDIGKVLTVSSTNPFKYYFSTPSSLSTSTALGLFSGTLPISFNSSTGVISWVNTLNYLTTSTADLLYQPLGSYVTGTPWTSEGYITSTLGNWQGTWQGVNSTTFYLNSNPSGFVTSSGQWTTTTLNNGIYYNNGNVGIGTSTPLAFAQLHIVTSSASGAIIALQNTLYDQTATSSKPGIIIFYDKNGTQSGYSGYGSNINNSYTLNNGIGAVRLMTHGTAASNIDLFAENNRVGINTGNNTPSSTFQVNGTSTLLNTVVNGNLNVSATTTALCFTVDGITCLTAGGGEPLWIAASTTVPYLSQNNTFTGVNTFSATTTMATTTMAFRSQIGDGSTYATLVPFTVGAFGTFPRFEFSSPSFALGANTGGFAGQLIVTESATGGNPQIIFANNDASKISQIDFDINGSLNQLRFHGTPHYKFTDGDFTIDAGTFATGTNWMSVTSSLGSIMRIYNEDYSIPGYNSAQVQVGNTTDLPGYMSLLAPGSQVPYFFLANGSGAQGVYSNYQTSYYTGTAGQDAYFDNTKLVLGTTVDPFYLTPTDTGKLYLDNVGNISASGTLRMFGASTLTTTTIQSLNGLLKGTSGLISVATPGVDYVASETDPIWTAVSTTYFNTSTQVNHQLTTNKQGGDGINFYHSNQAINTTSSPTFGNLTVTATSTLSTTTMAFNSTIGDGATYMQVVSKNVGGFGNIPGIEFNSPTFPLGNMVGGMRNGLLVYDAGQPQIILAKDDASAYSIIKFDSNSSDTSFSNANTYTFNNGNVIVTQNLGIGTTTPGFPVTVSGTIRISGDYKDDNVALASVGIGASAPGLRAINGGTIKSISFTGAATTEEIFWCKELDHGWKEGTAITPHIHWMPETADAGNVKWNLTYSILNQSGATSAGTTVSTTVAASGVAWQEVRTDFPTIDLTGKTIGTQICFRLFRDPTDTADTYANYAMASTFGYHYQVDSLGSRNITTK